MHTTHSERASNCVVSRLVVLTFTHQFTHPSNKTRSICHHFMLVHKIIILELLRAHTGVFRLKKALARAKTVALGAVGVFG